MPRERQPFPEVVDSSMISHFKACPRKFFYEYICHWKPAQESVHPVAGKAFASGIEAARRAFFVERLPSLDAQAQGLRALFQEYGTFECPEDSPKGPLKMAGALTYYFEQYPLGADGAVPERFGDRRGIEFSFLEPIPDSTHPETGNPLLYSGRADMVAQAFGGRFIYDEKTTSQLGATWANKWDHRSQFTGYCWGLRGFGIQPTGCVVRGVSILKADYGTAQAITYRSSWEVDRWLEMLQHQLTLMRQYWERDWWPMNLDDSCVAYGGCTFSRVCKSQNPAGWLRIHFHRRKWDPVSRVETDLSLFEETE